MGTTAQGSGRNGSRRRLSDAQAILVRLDKLDLDLLDQYCERYGMSRAGAVRKAVYRLLVKDGLLPPPLHPNGQVIQI